MLEPVAQQEGIVFVEIAVVEHQQEFAAVGIEALDRVRNAATENTRDRRRRRHRRNCCPWGSMAVMRARAVQHVGPFGRLVPMQLANAAGIQAHVHAGDILGDAEFPHGDLAGPAAGFLPHMGSPRTKSADWAACRDRSRAEPADRDSAGRGRDCAGRDRCRHVRDAAVAV